MKELLLKYKQVILYLIFGGFTTAVNFAVHFLFSIYFGHDAWAAQAIAWVAAASFAFITNKIFVFESKVRSRNGLLKESVMFFAARGISGLINVIGMLVLVDILGFNEFILYWLLQIFVVIFNYFASKWFIFNKSVN